jgi:hypothetical protein
MTSATLILNDKLPVILYRLLNAIRAKESLCPNEPNSFQLKQRRIAFVIELP